MDIFGWEYLAHPEAAKKTWSGPIQSCKKGIYGVIVKELSMMIHGLLRFGVKLFMDDRLISV